jgi:hypothetical protein
MSRAIHTDARAEQVLDLVVAGLCRREVLKWVETKSDWKIGTRQVDRLIALAHAALEATAIPHHQREPAKSIRRLDMLFARLLQINDYKACLAVERERIALLGLGDARKRGPEPLSVEELAAQDSWRAKNRFLAQVANVNH